MKEPFLNIPFSRTAKSSVWNAYEILIVFLGKQFLFVLHFTYTGDTLYQVWLNLNIFWPNEKDLFLKFVIREIRKFPCENLIFVVGKL